MREITRVLGKLHTCNERDYKGARQATYMFRCHPSQYGIGWKPSIHSFHQKIKGRNSKREEVMRKPIPV